MSRANLPARQDAMRRRQTVEAAPLPADIERPYTVVEVAALTGFSVQTIYRLFANERGVLVLELKKPRKRSSIRIPRHVYRRVMQRLTVQ